MFCLTSLPAAAASDTKLCAIRRVYVERGISYVTNPAGETFEREVESGRFEFLAVGSWVYVRSCVSSSETFSRATWHVMTREDAKKLFRTLMAGDSHFTLYRGTWAACEPTTELIGQVAIPAHREHISWGSDAYMYANVEITAQIAPIVKSTFTGEQHAMVAHMFTTPDKHTSARIEFHKCANGVVALGCEVERCAA